MLWLYRVEPPPPPPHPTYSSKALEVRYTLKKTFVTFYKPDKKLLVQSVSSNLNEIQYTNALELGKVL